MINRYPTGRPAQPASISTHAAADPPYQASDTTVSAPGHALVQSSSRTLHPQASDSVIGTSHQSYRVARSQTPPQGRRRHELPRVGPSSWDSQQHGPRRETASVFALTSADRQARQRMTVPFPRPNDVSIASAPGSFISPATSSNAGRATASPMVARDQSLHGGGPFEARAPDPPSSWYDGERFQEAAPASSRARSYQASPSLQHQRHGDVERMPGQYMPHGAVAPVYHGSSYPPVPHVPLLESNYAGSGPIAMSPNHAPPDVVASNRGLVIGAGQDPNEAYGARPIPFREDSRYQFDTNLARPPMTPQSGPYAGPYAASQGPRPTHQTHEASSSQPRAYAHQYQQSMQQRPSPETRYSAAFAQRFAPDYAPRDLSWHSRQHSTPLQYDLSPRPAPHGPRSDLMGVPHSTIGAVPGPSEPVPETHSQRRYAEERLAASASHGYNAAAVHAEDQVASSRISTAVSGIQGRYSQASSDLRVSPPRSSGATVDIGQHSIEPSTNALPSLVGPDSVAQRQTGKRRHSASELSMPEYSAREGPTSIGDNKVGSSVRPSLDSSRVQQQSSVQAGVHNRDFYINRPIRKISASPPEPPKSAPIGTEQYIRISNDPSRPRKSQRLSQDINSAQAVTSTHLAYENPQFGQNVSPKQRSANQFYLQSSGPPAARITIAPPAGPEPRQTGNTVMPSDRSATLVQDHPRPPLNVGYSSPMQPSKASFLNLFESFYDTLQDARVLKTALDENIRKSTSLLQTLQASSSTMQALMQRSLIEHQSKVDKETRKLTAMLEHRLDQLEKRRSDVVDENPALNASDNPTETTVEGAQIAPTGIRAADDGAGVESRKSETLGSEE